MSDNNDRRLENIRLAAKAALQEAQERRLQDTDNQDYTTRYGDWEGRHGCIICDF